MKTNLRLTVAAFVLATNQPEDDVLSGVRAAVGDGEMADPMTGGI